MQLGKISLTLAACERFEFDAAGQKLLTYAGDDLNTSNFDCLILCDTKIFSVKVPPEKIFTPALYSLFALTANPKAVVEIIFSDYEHFARNYGNVIKFYDATYPDKVRYTPVNAKNILPNSVRFLKQPTFKARYVYIGDVDFFLLEDLLNYWLDFMARHQSDFGNVLQNPNQLTGLQFIPYAKMYPIKIPPNTDLARTNDKVLLCQLMREKNFAIPDSCDVRRAENSRRAYKLFFAPAP